MLSTDVQTPRAIFAREWGYEVHHDHMGWYVVGPNEQRDEQGFNKAGYSLGFDGRKHYIECDEAWIHAYALARRVAKREEANFAKSFTDVVRL